MAEAMINRNKKFRSISTQTGETADFCINLSPSKHLRLYYSESYRDMVLSLNINQCKSFIFTRAMWKIFREHINRIDFELFNE